MSTGDSQYLENIIQETLYNFHISISIRGQLLSNWHFVDDIELIGDKEAETKLHYQNGKAAKAYRIDISLKKCQLRKKHYVMLNEQRSNDRGYIFLS